MKPPREIVLVHELGLGDHFICNALVNLLSEHYDRIFLPTYDIPVHANWHTVQCLYSENPRVVPLPVREWLSHTQYDNHWHTLGVPTVVVQLDRGRQQPMAWYKHFYHQFGFDYDSTCRQHFALPYRIPGAAEVAARVLQPLGGQAYRVVHNRSSAHGDYPLDLLTGQDLATIHIDPNISNNLLDWRDIFMGAEEIHVAHSSVFWLVDRMRQQLPGQLYYHSIRRTLFDVDRHDIENHTSPWHFVDYEVKL
jgi:hypothetical protein